MVCANLGLLSENNDMCCRAGCIAIYQPPHSSLVICVPNYIIPFISPGLLARKCPVPHPNYGHTGYAHPACTGPGRVT